MSRFGDAIAVKRVAAGRYVIDLDPGFAIAGALNGGYLLAVLGRAAVDASPHAHPVSTAANYLRVARGGRAEMIVEPRKEGRTTATFRVTLVQNDLAVIDALLTTGTLEPGVEASWAGEPPAPALPPLEECLDGQNSERDRGFADRVDLRFDPSTMGWLDGQPSGRPEIRGWFRFRDDPYEPDAYALAVAVDALPPVALNLGFSGWAPTVELTWHMRAIPAPGWLTLHGGGRLASGGWFDEEVEVWDATGRLVAQSRQMARVGRGSAG